MNASHFGRPNAERLNEMNPTTEPITATIRMYHWWVTMCEKSTMNWVSAGIFPGNCLNTLTNTGIRKATSASRTITAKLITTAG